MVEESFLKRHLGTDLLLGSWLFLLSTVFFAVVTAIQLYKVTDTDTIIWNIASTADDNDDVDDYYTDSAENLWLYALILVVSVVFIGGSYVFLRLAYPENIDKMVTTLTTVDVTTLSVWEKYFTANFLWMSWIFAFAFLLFIYPTWGVATIAESLAYGEVLIAVWLACLLVFVVFIAFHLPENMLATQGHGSSMVFDIMCSCCCAKEEGAFMCTHFGTDFLCAMWAIMAFAFCSIVASIYSLSKDSNDIENIIQFVACNLFLAGSILMLWASYPDQMKSDRSWRFLVCNYEFDVEDKDNRTPNESTRLLA
jgi:hypothetical protein